MYPEPNNLQAAVVGPKEQELIESSYDLPAGLGDRVIATAILDRLLHHAITVSIRGQSYRLKEKLKAGLVKPAESIT